MGIERIFKRHEKKSKITKEPATTPMSEQGQQNSGHATENLTRTEKRNISKLKDDPEISSYIDKMVQRGVKQALRGNTPKANTTDNTAEERAKFEKMTYKERLNLFNTNPQSYYKLSKGAKK